MASIKCKQCGYENPQGTDFCEMCAEPLMQMKVNIPPPSVPYSVPPQQMTVSQTTAPIVSEIEYFVLCPESQTKTVLPNGRVTSFLCNGCRKEHIIDGFLWQIESRTLKKEVPVTQPQNVPLTNENHLYLEEVTTHFRIDIDKQGGTLGRYGKYGADFFQSRDMRTVSGEHCMITFEHQSWVLRHISRTNQTKYNGMILSSNEPVLLENGKILTLANTVTFIVRIS